MFDELLKALRNFKSRIVSYKTPEYVANIKVINCQVSNACNSKCAMCNVWRQTEKQCLTLKDFKRVLADPLFKQVEHIGITGGEPTLVKNLPDYFDIAIDVLPNLQGLSTITNAILSEKAVELICDIKNLCEARQKSFSVMLSLDGLNDIHDLNRGVPGSFNSVQRVMDTLKNRGIAFSTGTTITKYNIWNLDELLIFLRENNIYGRFRIAEFINRLDNYANSDVIRNFDADETYQLLLFFSKLEFTYEPDDTVKNTYRSIKNMLAGGSRLIGCPYQEQIAINLDCYGGLAYCAPKSNVLGNLLKSNGLHLYVHNLEHLDFIKRNYCSSCIHDYHSQPKPELLEQREEERYWGQFFSIKQFAEQKEFLVVPYKEKKSNGYTVFIIGWYGTETVGDKAILAGIFEYYKKNYPEATFAISSLNPFITERTIKELDIKAEIVPVFSGEFFVHASTVDEVVVGGGPLMELEELSLILWAFYFAKKNKGSTTVFGCGIGPLYTDDKINAVKDILGKADRIYLRDAASVKTAIGLTGRTDIRNIGDPAVGYLRRNYSQKEFFKEETKLACFLRELTLEYRGSKNKEEFFDYKQKLEEALAMNIINLCDKYDLVPHFYSMHNFAVGNDDRDFNFSFTRKYFAGRKYYVENKLSTVENIVQAMKTSQLNVCMRFHSVVFANTLNTDFLAVDYTTGGKIFGYLSDTDKLQHLVSMDSIISDSHSLTNTFVRNNASK
ncbi:hypothetical protein SCACP_32140 [Sporomusa carbonis]|uniref:polysaccharide pyruvyl transferase family protein n=1 Tax=Sporomusa carbonis TaxID=3076075 RepID=UPI003A72C80F